VCVLCVRRRQIYLCIFGPVFSSPAFSSTVFLSLILGQKCIVNLSREIDILKNAVHQQALRLRQSQSLSTGVMQVLQKRSAITNLVHRSFKDMTRRKCNVIISGLPEPTCYRQMIKTNVQMSLPSSNSAKKIFP